MRFLRFDEQNTKSFQTDKFALISYIYNRFIDNNMKCYPPGPNITVDEQLFPTKRLCKFTQCQVNKSDQFAIQVWLAVDVILKYLINGFPYFQNYETRPTKQSLLKSVVIRLLTSFYAKEKNITMDNFFTSVALVHKHKKRYNSRRYIKQSKKMNTIIRRNFYG